MFVRPRLRSALAVLDESVRRSSAGAPKENGGLAFLLYDEFITPDASPLVSPRACEPGPGTLTVLDVAAKYSISGGTLECGTAGTGVNGKLYSTTVTPFTPGLAIVMRRIYSATGTAYLVFHTTAGMADEPATTTNRLWIHSMSASGFNAGRGPALGSSVVSPGVAGDTGLAWVVISPSCAVLVALRASTVELLMVYDPQAAGVTQAHYGLCSSFAGQVTTFERAAILDLTRPRNANPAGVDWSDVTSLAVAHDTYTDADGTALTAHTAEKGGPWTVQAGTPTIQSNQCSEAAASTVAHVVTAVSDVLVEVVFGATPANFSSVVFRRSGPNDCWALQYTGTQLVLYEIVAGVATNRGVTTKAMAAGDSLVVRASGSDIRCFHRSAAGVYTALTAYTSTVHQTATQHGIIAPVGAPVDRFTVFPVDITGALPEGL